MAYDLTRFNALRAAYINSRQSLAKAARAAGVPEQTARRWKKKSIADGDNWDKVRKENAKTGRRHTIGQLVDDLYAMQTTVSAEVTQSTEITPEKKAQLLTQLADSFTKVSSVAFRFEPENIKHRRLELASELISSFGSYLSMHRPDLGPAFLEVLEPFAVHFLRKVSEQE